MTEHVDEATHSHDDIAPGDESEGHNLAAGVRGYIIGLALAATLTVASFWIATGPGFIYPPGVLMALAALAIGQMGVHLAFFLHLTTGPDNLNNALALALGVLIVGIVIAGSIWIMYRLNVNMQMDHLHMHMPVAPRDEL